MKKVLFVATVDSHIELFHLPYLKMFKDKGYEVHVATDSDKPIKYCDKKIKLPIKRSPFSLSNFKAIRELKKIVNSERYSIIHCHTPMGGVVARLAAKKARKNGTRVIYTAHGFHFYKGAPLKNWLLFYPVEKRLAKFTDTLITINTEDFERAKKKFGKRCFDIQYVPGVGVDEKKFEKKLNIKQKSEFRRSLGLKDDDRVLIFPAEISKRKNQTWLIRTLQPLFKKDKKLHLLLPGRDSLDGKCQKLVRRLGLEKQVHFLGFRNDIVDLLQISDVAVSSAKQEGLPVNLMEAAFLGLSIVATDCRGNRDICKKTGGLISGKKSQEEFLNNVSEVLKNNSWEKYDLETLSLNNVMNRMIKIYNKKIKVLHILASNKFSGAENVACMIIDNVSNKFEMAYCSLDGPIKEVLNERKIKFYAIEKLNYKNVKRVINKYCPDIIHAHDYRASIVASMFNKKVIISHVHQNSPKVQKKSINSIAFLLASLRFKEIIWISKDAFCSYAFHKLIKAKSTVLLNVIDSKYIKRKIKESKFDKKYDLVFLGRLVEEKNPERALKILEMIKKRDSDISMAIVGDGEKLDMVKQMIKDHKLSKNVDMYGFQKNPYPILNNSKIMLMTSRREGIPISVLEAQSLSKPVVATKIDGLENLIKTGKNGFLSDSDEALCNDVVWLIDEKNYLKMSANVRKLFADSNSLSSYMDALFYIYNSGEVS